jgi:DNA-directed RNA polymerase subunit RPC12/RpoP
METIIKVITSREDYDIRDSAECSLSVQDIIDRLECLPRNAKVVMSNDNGFTFAPFRESTFSQVEVETKEEEEERLRKEAEEEERTHWVCPKCGGIDTPVYSVKGGYQCMECGERFKKPIIKIDNE